MLQCLTGDIDRPDVALNLLTREYQYLLREIDDVNIAFVDDEAPADTGEHIVLELLEDLIEEMQLECHLAALAIGQHQVRIVAVGTNVDNLVRGDSHQFGAGRYSEPFHAMCNYFVNIRISVEKTIDYAVFLTLFTLKGA